MTARIRLTSEDQQLIESLSKVRKGTEAVTQEMVQLSKRSAEVERSARRAFDETRTPLERYERKVKDLRIALRSGKIDLDTYNRAVDKQAQLLKKAGDASDGVADEDMLSRVGRMAAGFLSVNAAVQLFTNTMQEALEIRRELAQNTQESAVSFGELSQVSQDSRDAAILRNRARELRSSGAVGSLDTGANVAFSLRSAGLDDDFEAFKQIGQSNLVSDLGELIKSVATVRNAFGAESTGDAEAIVSKALVASGVSPANINQILTATAQTGAAASQAGISDEETFSGIAILSAQLGTTEQARTRLNSLFRSVRTEGIEGGSLQGVLTSIRDRLNQGETFEQVLGGRAEAVEAFTLLERDMGLLERTTLGVQRGNNGDALQERVRRVFDDPAVAAALSLRQAQGARDVQGELLGAQQNLRDAAFQSALAIDSLLGRGSVDQAISKGIRSTVNFFGGEVGNEFYRDRIDNARALGTEEGSKQADLLEGILGEIGRMNRTVREGRQSVTVPSPEAN